MAKAVGFSRTIKPQWIKKTIELINEEKTIDEIKNELDEYLSFELKDKTNIGKARNVLINTWAKDNELSKDIRLAALELVNKDSDNELPLSWCMMLMAYPVFSDLCKLIGKMSNFQDEFTLKQLKQKLYDEWGETTTLMYSIDKLVATLKYMEVLDNIGSGRYAIKRHRVSNPEVVKLMIYSMMKVDDAGYYTFVELQESIYMFPFEYRIAKETLIEDERFVMSNFGGETTVSIKE